MNVKLFSSEYRVMEILWKSGDQTAKELAARLEDSAGWSKTTSYTVIKKCIDKGVISRTDPGFCCHALFSREEAQNTETDDLIERLYDGEADRLVASILGRKKLSDAEIARLKEIVAKYE